MSKHILSNLDVVLYALYLLGGTQKKIFTEDIAKKSFELAPSRFSWRRYPQYPDIDPARLRLVEARSERGLITGRAGNVVGFKQPDGWIFSPKGISWIEKNRTRLSQAFGKNPEPVNRTILSGKLKELQSSTAYKKYIKDQSCENIKPYEFTDFLNASLDTPAPVLRDRIDKISALAASDKNKGLLDFIDECRVRFSNLLQYQP